MMLLDKLTLRSIRHKMEILNIIMSILFVLFMVFVFGGYHKTKSGQREKAREAQEKLDKEKS